MDIPLTSKELTELATRKRSYVWRCLFICAIGGCFYFRAYFDHEPDIGEGSLLMNSLIFGIIWASCIYIPATLSGIIAGERERSTLDLLALTSLGFSRIILQKFLAAIVPILTLLAGTLPLFAFCFTLGGVEVGQIVSILAFLLLNGLLIASITFYYSSIARGTLTASIGSVLVSAFPCLVSHVVLLEFATFHGIVFDLTLFCWIILSLGCLGASHYHLEKLHYNPPKPPPKFSDMRALDEIQAPHPDDLPGQQPILWRETSKTLRRHSIMLSMGALIAVGAGYITYQSPPKFYNNLQTVDVLILTLLTLWVIPTAINLFKHERHHQTLEPLLATPLDRQALLEEKFRSLWPLLWLAVIPLLGVVGVIAFVPRPLTPYFISGNPIDSYPLYLLHAGISLTLYFMATAWIGVTAGLYSSTRTNVLLPALLIAGGLCYPLMHLELFNWFYGWADGTTTLLANFGLRSIRPDHMLQQYASLYGIPYAFYLGIIVLLRRLCLRKVCQ